jgi:hypothetical protein
MWHVFRHHKNDLPLTTITTHFTTTSPRFYQHKNRGNRDIPNQNALSTTEKLFSQKP